MGTTAPEDTEKVRGVIRIANQTIEVVTDTAYGDKKTRRSVYPLVLILVIAVSLVIAGASAALPVPVAGLVALVLLALWVGGSGR